MSDPDWDVGVSEVLAAPYYEGTGFSGYAGDFSATDAVAYDRVPKGEVEVRRSSPVYSADEHHLGHYEADGIGDGIGGNGKEHRRPYLVAAAVDVP